MPVEFSLLKLIVAVIATEAVTEILTSTAIFEPIRSRLLGLDKERPKWLGMLASCGRCMSVWIGVSAAFLMVLNGPWWAQCLVWGVVIHRASNILHAVLSCIEKRVS
jgi:hypothetical protein